MNVALVSALLCICNYNVTFVTLVHDSDIFFKKNFLYAVTNP